MICPKSYNTCARGMILVDVLVAMSLVVFFVSIFSATIFSARKSFDRAHARMKDLVAQGLASSSLSPSPTLLPSVLPVSSAPVCSSDFMAADSSSLVSPAITNISLPVSSMTPLTHLEVRDGMAFVSSDSNAAADPDLFVFDINEANARLISSINTGPGISSFVLVGKRIFASASSMAAQLHIIDFAGVTSPSGPILTKKFQLPLPYATATPPYATAISFDVDADTANYSGRVYLGTEKWVSDEFAVIDVTDPLTPIWQRGLEISSQVNDIKVDSGISYIANAGQKQLLQDVLGGEFSPSGWPRQAGQVLSFFEGRLVFGRTSGGYDIATDHELFVWASSTATATGHTLGVADSSKNIPGGVYGIVQDKNHIYVVTRQAGKEFQIFDSALTSSTTFSLPTQPHSMTCDGATLYVLSNTSPTIYAISFTK